MLKSAFHSRAFSATCELPLRRVMGSFFIFRYICSKNIIGSAQPLSTLKSVPKYIWKRHFNAHRRTSKKDARKLSILPGVLFCRIVSNGPEYRHDLIYVTSCLYYAARAPPRKSEPVSKHIQIFGGYTMPKSIFMENSCKNFSYVFSARTLYCLPLEAESNGRVVRA